VKLHILSDLHNERLPYQLADDIDFDVLVAAGDIDERPERLVEWLLAVGKPVILVLGNHDYWSESNRYKDPLVDFGARIRRVRELTHDTCIHLLDNDAVELGDTRFLGATFWTSYGNRNRNLLHYGWNSMNDFSFIGAQEYLADPKRRKAFIADCERYGFQHRLPSMDWEAARFHPLIAMRLHHESAWYFRTALAERGSWRRTVVVTHHAPTYDSLIESGFVKPAALNSANWHERLDIRWDDDGVFRVASYASPEDDLVRHAQDVVDLWIHGHIHHAVDFSAGGVRIVANPRGYAFSRTEHQSGDACAFDPRLVVDLETQSGYMKPLKRKIDDAHAALSETLVDIRRFGDAIAGAPSATVKTALEESFIVRLERFDSQANAIAKRVHENIHTRFVSVQDFPASKGNLPEQGPHLGMSYRDIFGTLSRQHPTDDFPAYPQVTPQSIYRLGEDFLDALAHCHELPALATRYGQRYIELAIKILGEAGIVATCAPSAGPPHVRTNLELSIDSSGIAIDTAGVEALRQTVSQAWYQEVFSGVPEALRPTRWDDPFRLVFRFPESGQAS
jgi:3',5'-cyclic AMP phosphodiesterase CpdA